MRCLKQSFLLFFSYRVFIYLLSTSSTRKEKIYKYIKDNYADYLKGYLKKDIILRDAKNILSDVNYKKFVKYFDMYKDKI